MPTESRRLQAPLELFGQNGDWLIVARASGTAEGEDVGLLPLRPLRPFDPESPFEPWIPCGPRGPRGPTPLPFTIWQLTRFPLRVALQRTLTPDPPAWARR